LTSKDFDGKENYPCFHEEPKDIMEILGHWSNRPTFKQIISSYRKRMD
jgi:hypothetical protein